MCNSWCLDFVRKSAHFVPEGADILEVGSQDVNGTARTILNYKTYFGVDILPGKNVDEVMSVYDLENRLGRERYDVVVSTELLEHLEDWAEALYQIVSVCKSKGYIYLTTRSEGFPFHEYPIDAWRFSLEDMENIMSPIGLIVAAEKDPTYGSPGIGVVVRRDIPDDKIAYWADSLYYHYSLYSVKLDHRALIKEAYPKSRS